MKGSPPRDRCRQPRMRSSLVQKVLPAAHAPTFIHDQLTQERCRFAALEGPGTNGREQRPGRSSASSTSLMFGRFVVKMILRPCARTTPSAIARKRCRSWLPLLRARSMWSASSITKASCERALHKSPWKLPRVVDIGWRCVRSGHCRFLDCALSLTGLSAAHADRCHDGSANGAIAGWCVMSAIERSAVRRGPQHG